MVLFTYRSIELYDTKALTEPNNRFALVVLTLSLSKFQKYS